ncbi:MAG: hypothetical protein IKR85_01780 [Clostridia bacterium]|nr:hypothetical protein [Clostridia bacterium]
MKRRFLLMLYAALLVLLGGLCMAAEENIQAYPVPEGTPRQAVWFRVYAGSKEAGVYSDYNMEFDEVNFAYFNFRAGTQVTVKIEVLFDFRSVNVLPARRGEAMRVEGQTVYLDCAEPGADYSFVFDNDYQYITLHLFTSPIDEDEDKYENDFNTLYFGPGYHDLSAGQLNLRSGQTLYVAPGAVLNGPVVAERVHDVSIRGSGVIMMDKPNAVNPQYGNIVITLNNAKNVYIGGVIAHAHRAQNWTTHVYYSQNVTIENYRVVSTRYASVDALDISNSSNVEITGCFLRSCDDCITIKGLSSASSPSLAPPNEHIHVRNCRLWNDCNNAMVIGEESMAAYYDDISFKDIDVLYSYDDRDNHGRLEERAVMSIVTLHGTYIRNITWEDVRVNDCQRLVCFTFLDSFWFGSIRGDQSFPGGIENVLLKNIDCVSANDGAPANQILMRGWSKDKQIKDVRFENFRVNGQRLTGLMNPLFRINEFISNISFA